MRRPRPSVAALLVVLVAAIASAATKGPIEERLENEHKKLADLQAELQRLQKGTAPARKPEAAPPEAKAQESRNDAGEATKGRQPKAPDTQHATPDTPSPLTRRPSLAAAGVLYRLGRFKQARAVYEAALARKGLDEADRIWAGLQAGNCCRRLGDYDAAIEHFQAIVADDADHPWCTGHVAWAVKTAQWEKRWARLELKAASSGADSRGD